MTGKFDDGRLLWDQHELDRLNGLSPCCLNINPPNAPFSYFAILMANGLNRKINCKCMVYVQLSG